MNKLTKILFLVCASALAAQSLVAEGHKIRPRLISAATGNANSVSAAFIFSANGVSCSGSAISRRLILTAAHCVKAFAGSSKVTAVIGSQQLVATKGYIAPSADIGVLVVSSSIKAAPYKIKKGLFPQIGASMLVLGFGNPKIGDLSYGYLSLSSYLSSETFLASNRSGTATCTGDSGGPALVTYNGATYIVGVVSAGDYECQVNSRTLFVSPSSTKLSNWLNSMISRFG